MKIDLSQEALIRLTEAVQFLPGQPHVSTLWRWCHRGVLGVRLETIVGGGRRYTSKAAIGRFIERTTAARDGDAVSFYSGTQG